MRASLIFLILTPAFIALGHDMYLFYNEHLNPGVFSFELLKEKFKFSALGFIWTTYAEESYKAVFRTTDPKIWKIIDTILTLKAFYVGLGFAGFMMIIFFIMKLFGKGPLVNEEIIHGGKPSKNESFRAGSQNKKLNYKRK